MGKIRQQKVGLYDPKNEQSKTPFYHKLGQTLRRLRGLPVLGCFGLRHDGQVVHGRRGRDGPVLLPKPDGPSGAHVAHFDAAKRRSGLGQVLRGEIGGLQSALALGPEFT